VINVESWFKFKHRVEISRLGGLDKKNKKISYLSRSRQNKRIDVSKTMIFVDNDADTTNINMLIPQMSTC
jgi:hypothetical protein